MILAKDCQVNIVNLNNGVRYSFAAACADKESQGMDTNTNHERDTSIPESNAPKTSVPEANDPETDLPETPEAADAIPENAFLIIEGLRVHPLREPIVNIGRRLENHVVIDDPRISRQHAQLRALKGHFVLFDLNSTGGTFVNGQRANQTVLYPDDVISLAGVILVFGQDIQHIDLVETAPLSGPGSTAQPTATMERKTVDVEAVGGESRTDEDSSTEAGTLP